MIWLKLCKRKENNHPHEESGCNIKRIRDKVIASDDSQEWPVHHHSHRSSEPQ